MTGDVPFEFLQHASVFVIALAAAVVVLRRVLGVFEARPTGPAVPGSAQSAGPACSHCAAGNAAMKKQTPR